MAERSDDFEDLFEHAPCGYLSADATGRITRANATFSAWTGFESRQLVGRRFQEFLNIAGRIYYETHFAPLLRMQGFFNEVALDIVKADGGKLPVLVNAVERRTGEAAHSCASRYSTPRIDVAMSAICSRLGARLRVRVPRLVS